MQNTLTKKKSYNRIALTGSTEGKLIERLTKEMVNNLLKPLRKQIDSIDKEILMSLSEIRGKNEDLSLSDYYRIIETSSTPIIINELHNYLMPNLDEYHLGLDTDNPWEHALNINESHNHTLDKYGNLIKLLNSRFTIVREIGLTKKENSIKSKQSDRWKDVEQMVEKESKKLGMNCEAILVLWNMIHKRALEIENEIQKQ